LRFWIISEDPKTSNNQPAHFQTVWQMELGDTITDAAESQRVPMTTSNEQSDRDEIDHRRFEFECKKHDDEMCIRQQELDLKREGLKKGGVKSTLMELLKIFAVPLSIAVGSWCLQFYLVQTSVNKEYVALCIGILSSKDADTRLREWATKLLNATSPVPLPAETQKSLETGVSFLPPPARALLERPPDISMAFSGLSNKRRRDEVKLLNSAIQSINNPTVQHQNTLTLLETRRDGILRQQFGPEKFELLQRHLVDSDSLTETEQAQTEEILKWYHATFNAP